MAEEKEEMLRLPSEVRLMIWESEQLGAEELQRVACVCVELANCAVLWAEISRRLWRQNAKMPTAAILRRYPDCFHFEYFLGRFVNDEKGNGLEIIRYLSKSGKWPFYRVMEHVGFCSYDVVKVYTEADKLASEEWEYVSEKCSFYENAFLEKYKNELNWTKILLKGGLDKWQAKKYAGRVDWKAVSEARVLSAYMMKDYKKYLHWNIIQERYDVYIPGECVDKLDLTGRRDAEVLRRRYAEWRSWVWKERIENTGAIAVSVIFTGLLVSLVVEGVKIVFG